MGFFKNCSISCFYLFIFSSPIITLSTGQQQDIHDLLPNYGFPKGLIPNAVDSYSHSSDGTFIVKLTNPCYVHFNDQLVYYHDTISGNLAYGSVSDVSGIQAKKLGIWVTVTGMTRDSGSDMIVFHVGVLSKKLPAKEFEQIPNCQKSKGCHDYIPRESI